MNIQANVFKIAYQVLLSGGKATSKKLLQEEESPIENACDLLNNVKEEGRVHVTGMGRSGIIARMIGDLLRDIHFRVSYLGDTLARPVRDQDVVIAISGSGWTRTTALNVEASIEQGARVISITNNVGSKIARFADCLVPIPEIVPGRAPDAVVGYLERQIAGQTSPLTPLGTLFEINSLLVGAGIVSGIHRGNPLEGFKLTTKKLLQNAEDYLNQPSYWSVEISTFIKKILNAANNRNRIFWDGLGLAHGVASMSAMRFQHLGLSVAQIDGWRFKRAGDILVAFSGSGETDQIVSLAKEARNAEMYVIGITSRRNSSIGSHCDLLLSVGTLEKEIRDYLTAIATKKGDFYSPFFEYAAIITLDAIVSDLASILGKSESSMKREHANIE